MSQQCFDCKKWADFRIQGKCQDCTRKELDNGILNNCDCIRFHTSLSEHDWELIKEGRAMSDRDTRRGI